MKNDSAYRIALGFIALFMAANGLMFWFAFDTISPSYGLTELTSALGQASVRTDVGGYFIMLALFASYAAYKRNATAALIGAGMFFVAMTGRVISMGFDGVPPNGVVPLVVEALSATALLLSARKWGTSAQSDAGIISEQPATR